MGLFAELLKISSFAVAQRNANLLFVSPFRYPWSFVLPFMYRGSLFNSSLLFLSVCVASVFGSCNEMAESNHPRSMEGIYLVLLEDSASQGINVAPSLGNIDPKGSVWLLRGISDELRS